jgi:hypothetical protein
LSTQIGSKQVASGCQKKFQKNEKKACHRHGPSFRPDAGATNRPVQAFKKNEKKACQASKSLINATLTNQTNGETNDKKRAK